MVIEKNGQQFEPRQLQEAQGMLIRMLGNLDQPESLMLQLVERMAEDLVVKGHRFPDHGLSVDQALALRTVVDAYLPEISDTQTKNADLLGDLIDSQITLAHQRQIVEQGQEWKKLIGREPLKGINPLNNGRPISFIRYGSVESANKQDPEVPNIRSGLNFYAEIVHPNRNTGYDDSFQVTPISKHNKATEGELGPHLGLILAGLSVENGHELSALALINDAAVSHGAKQDWRSLLQDFVLLTKERSWSAALAGGFYGNYNGDWTNYRRKYVDHVHFAQDKVKKALGIDTRVLIGPSERLDKNIFQNATHYQGSTSILYKTASRLAIICQNEGRASFMQSFNASEVDAIESVWRPAPSIPSLTRIGQRIAHIIRPPE